MKIAELKQVDNMLLDWSYYYLLPIEQDCFWMDIRIFNQNRSNVYEKVLRKA